MKKLSEYRGEEALEILADLIEPAAEIMTDKKIAEAFRGKNAGEAIKIALKDHKRSILNIMARLDGEDPAAYAPNVFALPRQLLEIFNDPDLVQLFSLQGQNAEQTISGSATGNTEAR